MSGRQMWYVRFFAPEINLTSDLPINQQLHELELNDMIEVEADGRLQYNWGNIMRDKEFPSSNVWKWVLGLVLLMIVVIPSWMHY